jgi:hypothetical protein
VSEIPLNIVVLNGTLDYTNKNQPSTSSCQLVFGPIKASTTRSKPRRQNIQLSAQICSALSPCIGPCFPRFHAVKCHLFIQIPYNIRSTTATINSIFAVAFKINAPKTAILSKGTDMPKHRIKKYIYIFTNFFFFWELGGTFFTPLPLLSTHRHVSLCSSTSCGAGVTRPLPIAKEVGLEIPNQSNWIWPNHFQVSKKIAKPSLPIDRRRKIPNFLRIYSKFCPRTSKV